MTKNKEQRWAMIPPAEPASDDATRTQRRVRTTDEAQKDPAVSRRRARTQPEPPDLDQLAQQVASSGGPLPRAPQDLLSGTNLSSPSREAATAPPDTPPTWLSPAEDAESGPRATLVDLAPTEGGAAEDSPGRTTPAAVGTTVPILVERSRAVSLPTGEGGETLPSPPWQVDET